MVNDILVSTQDDPVNDQLEKSGREINGNRKYLYFVNTNLFFSL